MAPRSVWRFGKGEAGAAALALRRPPPFLRAPCCAVSCSLRGLRSPPDSPPSLGRHLRKEKAEKGGGAHPRRYGCPSPPCLTLPPPRRRRPCCPPHSCRRPCSCRPSRPPSVNPPPAPPRMPPPPQCFLTRWMRAPTICRKAMAALRPCSRHRAQFLTRRCCPGARPCCHQQRWGGMRSMRC